MSRQCVWHLGDRATLLDKEGCAYGVFHVTELEGDLVCGAFHRSLNYDKIEHLFTELEGAAYRQELPYAVEIEDCIAKLNLVAQKYGESTECRLEDVQITAENVIVYRV